MFENSDKLKNRAGLVFLLRLTAVALYCCYVLVYDDAVRMNASRDRLRKDVSSSFAAC